MSDTHTFNGGKSVAPSKSNTIFRSTKSTRRYDLQRGIRQNNSEKSRAAKRRVIKMLFVVVYEFFLCWTPLYVIQTLIIVDFEYASKHLTPEAVSCINLLAYVSSCCNPITYCFMNRNFRQGFLSAFRCVRNRKKWQRSKSECASYSGNYPSMSRTVISTVSATDKYGARDKSSSADT